MNHDQVVAKLFKPGKEMLAELTPDQAVMMNMAMGLAGEAGEVVDLIKKHTVYQKDIDLPKLIEELGDVEYYLAAIRHLFDINRDVVLQKNVDKLSKRYPSFEYSNEAANARRDMDVDS